MPMPPVNFGPVSQAIGELITAEVNLGVNRGAQSGTRSGLEEQVQLARANLTQAVTLYNQAVNDAIGAAGGAQP